MRVWRVAAVLGLCVVLLGACDNAPRRHGTHVTAELISAKEFSTTKFVMDFRVTNHTEKRITATCFFGTYRGPNEALAWTVPPLPLGPTTTKTFQETAVMHRPQTLAQVRRGAFQCGGG